MSNPRHTGHTNLESFQPPFTRVVWSRPLRARTGKNDKPTIPSQLAPGMLPRFSFEGSVARSAYIRETDESHAKEGAVCSRHGPINASSKCC